MIEQNQRSVQLPKNTERTASVPASMDRSHQHIIDFVGRHTFFIDDYVYGERTLRIIDSVSDGAKIPHDTVSAYLKEQEIVTADGVFTNCFDIAAKAVKNGVTYGRAHAPDGCQKVLGYGNHAVNYDLLPDGTVVAIDFTAATNLDSDRGNYATLGIRARDQNELFALLGEFYGGQWQDTREFIRRRE